MDLVMSVARILHGTQCKGFWAFDVLLRCSLIINYFLLSMFVKEVGSDPIIWIMTLQ